MTDWWWLILVLIVLFYEAFAYLIYQKTFRLDPTKDYRVVNQQDPLFLPSYTWFQKAPHEEVTIKSYDGVTLRGVFLPSQDDTSKNLAIVDHGYKACGEDMILIAEMYNNLGFKVLLINHRGHGGSGGAFTTLGHHEKYDLKKWIEFALRTYGSTDQILLHGVSIGAATIMMTSALRIPSNVRYLVLDSGFSSLHQMLAVNIRPKWFKIFLPGVNVYTYFFHKFFLPVVSPLTAIRKSKIPMLIIHGEKDEMVPFEMGKKLYETSKAPYKEFYPIPECPHGFGFRLDKPGLERFLREQLPQFFDIPKSYMKTKK
ncbi:MAG: alpha/beta hydrolase [Candidatus Izemoplasmatales bacterium]|nr:alpha/beta hydrolase [Candidatus Izemoplasmatales bacterium]